MKYNNIISAKFISRPNRFVANVKIDGKETAVHVKNTGRCRELLLPDSTVYLEDFTNNPRNRKLMYDLIAVEKGNLLINMDSQVPNKVVREALENGIIRLPEMESLTLIRPETVYCDSRFDFYIEDNSDKIFLEVKGVTLEKDGVVLFPDAPTQRGLKHINELCEAVKQGYGAYIFFVVQMDNVKYFTPNKETHKAFADALKKADKKGVKIKCFNSFVKEDELFIKDEVKVML